jgi:hypothetical protein
VSDRRHDRRLHRRAALLASVGLAVVVCGCSGGSDEEDVMLPSSLAIPTTAPSAASPSTTTSTATSPPTSAAIPADGAPGFSALQAELAQATCTDGAVDVAITFELDAEPPVRIVTAFVDGSTTPAGAAAGDAGSVTAAGLPCDGNAHLILVIATTQGGESTTQSATVRTPPSG